MADSAPFRVICLIPASMCLQLRNAFQQPVGNESKRIISEKVKNNIHTYAPQCHKQGIIDMDGLPHFVGGW